MTFLQNLHECLFSDVYTWAGKIRTTDISKGSTRFCTVSRIKPEADKLFHALEHQDWLSNCSREELVCNMAESCGDLNMIHPFREGNGRIMRMWCDFIIINAGFEVDWESVEPDLWLKASIDSATCDFRAMKVVFDHCIGDRFTPP
ncbi:Fic/DOC family protein [Marinobacterium alkalitolerans]|uniref:Fic/DOC family protein n=1 Tax=Marinobacterium alkalitolerans TaxID=1542925 RepID=UPI001ADDD70B|nr:Fic family protein [Marinobacterium alkalitolerans]